MSETLDDRPAQPVIVTLQLDADSAAFFEGLRRKHFPLAINHVGAHLTLFHNLPASAFETILKIAGEACGNASPFDMTVSGLMKLGRGVAYRIESERLHELRAALATQFKPWLIKQDRERFRPHITIQNKVSPEQASALYDHLSADLEPFTARAEGLQFWFYEGGRNRSGRYRPGTWAPAGAMAFSAAAPDSLLADDAVNRFR